MQRILDHDQIATLIASLAHQITKDASLKSTPDNAVALVGIRSRGELIAQRIADNLQQRFNFASIVGALDITMYRDDLSSRAAISIPQGTEMDFRLDDRPVILVDDVLDTGRSVRAALDALVDYGRPRFIRLAVLIDRGRHEYPIAADYTGQKIDPPSPKQKIVLKLKPNDPEDAVYLR